jgi:hypothetical protein
MKKLILLLLFPLLTRAQTCLLVYDYMETYTWFGDWNTLANTGFYTNYFVSSNASAALIGAGNGSSGLESAIYVLPNVTGLNTIYAHKLSFRLASYRVSNPTAATAGVDGADYVDVRYSTNNGTTAFTEMRIAGNANAYWDYNTATAAKIASGAMTTYAPIAGGNRTAIGDGYSVIELTIPAGATQLAFNLNCRMNSAGEEWWIDNAELIQLGPCVVLPIELIDFSAVYRDDGTHINWLTATELNNEWFVIDKSTDGYSWKEFDRVKGQGTVNTPTSYILIDTDVVQGYNYYQLKQIDFGKQEKYLGIVFVYIDFSKTKNILMIIDILGRNIENLEEYIGVYIVIYDDGTTKKYVNN